MSSTAGAFDALPVRSVLATLSRTLEREGAAVLCAPPGSGKTTAVPLALMDAPWLAGQRIVMLEPRRVAARAAARYMASRLGESVGQRVGFRVRFESAVSAGTRVEVVTEGVLSRRLQREPDLPGVGLVIFDEFHERNLEGDLALALALDSRGALREDLRILVMSATLDAAPVARLLGDAPVVEASGRVYPVDVRHQERADQRPTTARVAPAVNTALEAHAGDVLVFLPGAREIRDVGDQLRARSDILVCPLHGSLPAAEQDRAMRRDPGGRRRVVLATNIAETSLTIDGVSAVVDCGLARRPRFDPGSGLTRLTSVAVSRASAAQRAGRAGRLGPGLALRLWTEAEHARRPEHEPAEILEADLCGLVLELAAWGVHEPGGLAWLDPPPPGAWNQARELLTALGALDVQGRITAHGKRLSRLPAHPRLASMIAAAGDGAARALAADLAAILDGPDIAPPGSGCDLLERLAELARYRGRGRNQKTSLRGGRGVAQVDRAAAQLRGRATPHPAPAAAAHEAGRLLLAAYPDRLAKRRGAERGRFQLVTGRGLTVPEDDRLAGAAFLVVPDLDAGAREARAWRAAEVSREDVDWRLAGAVSTVTRVEWDPLEAAVASLEETRIGALVLESRRLDRPPPEQVCAAMADGVRAMGLSALPWNEDCHSFTDRVESLRHWQPDAGWPAMTEEALLEDLDAWLTPFLPGLRRRDHLPRLDLAAALRARVPAHLLPRMDEGAPLRLAVPGGSRVRLGYRPGQAPVLAVKLQEMFGCTETPRVCWGRVPVQVHLLSPARRPLHVTQDLASFWANAYPEVRKEMRGRYPKHPWPEDPLSAVPTARTRPRKA